MFIRILMITWFVATPSFAAKFAKVVEVEGDVTFAGQAVSAGTWIEKKGQIITGADGKAKIFLPTASTNAYLTPNSKLDVKGLSKKGKLPLVDMVAGMIRWVVTSKDKKPVKLRVRSRSAVMGVRGTDFITIVQPLLNETEIVCFEGKVQMTSRLSKGDRAMVGANQWGGVGGRFGQKIGDILTLPNEVMKYFDAAVPVK